MATRKSRRRSLMGGPIQRPVNRVELAGAILAVVLLQTVILLFIYPTDRNVVWDQRLDAVEAWAKSAAARNELVLDHHERLSVLEERLVKLEKRRQPRRPLSDATKRK